MLVCLSVRKRDDLAVSMWVKSGARAARGRLCWINVREDWDGVGLFGARSLYRDPPPSPPQVGPPRSADGRRVFFSPRRRIQLGSPSLATVRSGPSLLDGRRRSASTRRRRALPPEVRGHHATGSSPPFAPSRRPQQPWMAKTRWIVRGRPAFVCSVRDHFGPGGPDKGSPPDDGGAVEHRSRAQAFEDARLGSPLGLSFPRGPQLTPMRTRARPDGTNTGRVRARAILERFQALLTSSPSTPTHPFSPPFLSRPRQPWRPPHTLK